MNNKLHSSLSGLAQLARVSAFEPVRLQRYTFALGISISSCVCMCGIFYLNNDNPRNSFEVAAGWRAGSPTAGWWQGWPAAILSVAIKKYRQSRKSCKKTNKNSTFASTRTFYFTVSLPHPTSLPAHAITLSYVVSVIHCDYENSNSNAK